MQTNIQKWGNSLAVRIPSYIANKLSIECGDSIDLIANDHQITIRPRKNSLTSMLDKITEENIHNIEWDDSDIKGKELW
ncbi:MAG: AbrB/MazE/SpoVT family DNA-binding domain-containing protein [Pseudomonadota bacterium]